MESKNPVKDFLTLPNTIKQTIYKVNDWIFKPQGAGIIGNTGPKDNRPKLSKQHPIIIEDPYDLKDEPLQTSHRLD